MTNTAGTHQPRERSRFALVDLMVTLVIVSVVGAPVVRLLLGETRFGQQEETRRSAPAVSSGSVNMLLSDLRIVEARGGLDPGANARDFTLRVPYAFGLVCASDGLLTTVSLLPIDSSRFAAPGLSGFAWRNPTTGGYTYVSRAPRIASPGTTATCTGAGIAAVPASGSSPAGLVVDLTASVSPAPTAGSVLFLYRRIRYEFRPSAAVPGRDGLWRTVQGQPDQELTVPFDTATGAAFLRMATFAALRQGVADNW